MERAEALQQVITHGARFEEAMTALDTFPGIPKENWYFWRKSIWSVSLRLLRVAPCQKPN